MTCLRLLICPLIVAVLAIPSQGQTVTLPHTTPPLIFSAKDEGPVSGDLPVQSVVLMLKRSADRETALEQLLADQQNPASLHYHEWLTPGQFGERFGPSERDIHVVIGWLQSQGFHIDRVGAGRRQIEFSGSARQIENAFHTEIHHYEFRGKRHTANSGDISIPQALAPSVAGIVSLHDFFATPDVSRITSPGQHLKVTDPRYTTTSSNVPHYMSPYDLATIYDVLPLWNDSIDGSGQSIAIVGQSNIDLDDVRVFRSNYGLPPNDPQIIVNTDPGPPANDADEIESDLDVEWAGAVAKGAAIKLVVSKSTAATAGVILSASYAVDNNTAPVMSMSYGACESMLSAFGNQFFYMLWQQAAAQGISVFVASGDTGSAGCDQANAPETAAVFGLAVNGNASTPYNVAVGGTQFNEEGADSLYWNSSNSSAGASAKGYIPEVVWNESETTSSLRSGGGGVSLLYSTPSWQTGYGVPAVDPGTTDQHHRYLPDISLGAAADHDPYVIVYGGVSYLLGYVGGTSIASPAVAGIMAMINQLTKQSNGNPNPRLYAVAAQTPSAFHDITTGSNAVPCASGSPNCSDGLLPLYDATPGYDLATGWGSIDANVLAHAWQPPPPTVVSVTPNSGSGTSQSFAVTVGDAAGANAIGMVYVLFSNTLNAGSGCYLAYRVLDNTLWLSTDAGAWQTPSVLGSGPALTNNQCTVSPAGSSMTSSGTSLTVSAAIGFSPTFSCAQNIYVLAADSSNQNSGWQIAGTWTLPGLHKSEIFAESCGRGR